jgi:glyoxylase-like metal-dependent hydrolase (beta-lactamase superfamily II)
MSVRIDIISIGTLGRNLLWNESAPRRTAHATTTLIRAGKRTIVVDPGLPAPALQARFNERIGGKIEEITDVFLTHIGNDSIAGLELLEHAKWWCSEAERELLAMQLKREKESANVLRELLKRLHAAPDKLMPAVDLFPLPGYTAGTCGLLIAAPLSTTLVAGPAVPTLDHFLAGQVLPDVKHLDKAKESLTEVYEIADIIVPGYDNYFANPRGMGGGVEM